MYYAFSTGWHPTNKSYQICQCLTIKCISNSIIFFIWYFIPTGPGGREIWNFLCKEGITDTCLSKLKASFQLISHHSCVILSFSKCLWFIWRENLFHSSGSNPFFLMLILSYWLSLSLSLSFSRFLNFIREGSCHFMSFTSFILPSLLWA